ncbi:RE1 [Symbiodinium sp. CCMP2592]|nr:RE1 [Symbiodinium sp. CCMP2592]
MRQLQEVQLKQMERKDGPEVVKPGISSLPTLELPGKDTSPVDIQDWLEEVGSIMGDLSDTSHEWWSGVREIADGHYKKWVTATPMEKLEHGKYGRVNARAAGMILSALPPEVKSEMVTKKVTGSSLSLVFKLLTTYRPGGEQEKTLLLEQLTSPEGAQTPETAVQALRRWGRWFTRAKDLTVAVPDPVLMVKGLALIVAPVLVKNQDVWLRTTMMRNRLQLDSNPTEVTTLDFHKHLQAEMELLSTSTATAATSRASARIKSASAAQDSPSTTTAPAAKVKPDRKEKLCKWFAKSDDGCRRGADCQFQHDWGSTSKAGRCLTCSAVGHQKKDCPTKKHSDAPQQSPASGGSKGKGKGDKGATSSTASSSTTAAPATRSVTTATTAKDTPQPGPEPSPTGSPTGASKEPPGDLQQILSDAHQMLKSMMATTAPTTSSTSTGAPTYESIQRQLDEMKLKTLKVKAAASEEDNGRGALLDSGATHVLRPARDEMEHLNSKEVPVVLAGDERRLLRQTPAGSIILNPREGEQAQTIIPLGKLVESLGCTLRWTRGALMLRHPKYGTIRTRIRAGCPEIADEVQAAQLIAELESRRVEELRQKTEDLQDRLNAIKMMEVKKDDWRQDLAAYAEGGCVVDGLQALYKSPVFKNLPEDVLMGMTPYVEANDKDGWEYLKALPVSRRIRKKLLRSRAWVLNLYGGRNLKQDPVQSLNGQINKDTNTEVVVVNAEILLDGGWSVRGKAYKAMMWAAMTSRIKAVIGTPPVKTFESRPYVDSKEPKPRRTAEEPYGVTGLNPTEIFYVNKETSLVARQFLLYLVAHACSKGKQVAWMMSAPGDPTETTDPREGVNLWQTPMVKEFLEVIKPLGASMTTVGVTEDEEGKGPALTVSSNFGANELMEPSEEISTPISTTWCEAKARTRRSAATALRTSGVASTVAWEPQGELRKLTAEQGWKLHVQRDHVPYRKDCEYCVMMMGSGKQHRRTRQKSAYVLSIDVGGPMRIKSKDSHGRGYRYFLAASYSRPRFPDQDPPPEPDPGDMASLEYDFSDLEPEKAVDEPLDEEGRQALLESELADIEPSEPEVEEELPPKVQAMKAADKLWDDDDLAAEEQAKVSAEQEPLEGNHEIPMDHLYFMKPLKTKTGKEVMRAIQEVVLQLRQENLPVLRIHSDRAHEMRSPALRAWTLDNNIWLTRTEGQAPQSNGSAERAVRFLKGRARMLLKAAGLGTEHWATAMEAAAHRQREERLRPEDPQVPCPYGTRVAIKKKRYGDGGRHDLLPHWTKGVYMGPVWDVNGGSVILEDESNRFTVTTHLRARLRDPGSLKDEEEIEVLPLRPARRLRGKGPIGPDGVAVKSLEKKDEGKLRETLVKEILDLMARDPVHKVKRPQLANEKVMHEDTSYSTVGAYNFGGKFGITKYTKEAPELTARVTQLLQHDFPGEVFTSATIVRNAAMPTHKDSFNERHSYNLISPLKVTKGAGVWEELQAGDVFKGKYHSLDVNGKDVPGQVHQLTSPVKVNPRRWHSPIQGTEGPRVLIAGHTINSWRKLTNDMREELFENGFVLPDEEDFEARLKALKEQTEKISGAEYEVDEEDFVLTGEARDSIVEVDEDVKSLYTRDIEKVLAELDGDLRVVHTVHPSEVEQAIDEWIPALKAEVDTLVGINAVKRLRGKEARDYMAQPGTVIVPGKAVYTVKPPSKEGTRYRRKARIVSCGNFQPKSDDEINYSGGAVAEAVRLGIAEGSRRKWSACTGDVVSAFLRAPVPEGTRLALRPPAALVKAGLAEPDEIWVVQMALYGFRSSPRWWSTHRTQKMKEAITKAGLTFVQGQADADVWQIKGADQSTVGLMIVYVDDFLILGPRWVTDDAYEWMASTWEVTPCQYASPTASVRFLGMEIKQEVDGEGNISGYALDQEGYIQELLRQHDVGPTKKSLLPSAKEWMSLDAGTFPETYTQEQLRAAQSITGELAWLAQRCRPDLSYTVSVMGSLTTRDPVRVCTIGRKTLAYLNATKEWKLNYHTGGLPELVTYTDSSYSPDGEKSHGGAVVFWAGAPVAWKSSRQSLVTTSSAETELLEASEGATLTYSIDAMLSDVGVTPTSREIRVDNSAAITLASEEGGSWRTRHLKVRAAALRQRIQDGWATIAYCPGEWQLADGLTKILASKRMEMLMRKWGLGRPGERDRGEDGQERLRCLQAPAKQQEQREQQEHLQPTSNTTSPTPSTAHGKNLGCCMGLLVLAQWLVSVQGHRVTETDPDPEPLSLTTSWELYALAAMLMICAVAMWEGCKNAVKGRGEVARLRSVEAAQGRQRLTKVELRTLSALLQRDRESLSHEERMDLIHLAGLCGSDVSEAVGMNVSMKPTRQDEPQREQTCSAGVKPGEEDYPPPPKPYATPERPVKKSSKMSSPMPMASWEDPMWTERPQLVSGRSRRIPATQDAAIQCELQGEIPKKVFMTPKGTCVHASRSCSTLNLSTRFQERDVCQKCIKGQREETEYRGSSWLR